MNGDICTLYNCYKTQPVAILLGSTMKYKFGYPPRDNTVGKQCGPQGFLFMGGPITPAWFNGAQIFPAFQGPTTLALVAFQGPPTLRLVAFQGPPTAALVAFQGPPVAQVPLKGLITVVLAAFQGHPIENSALAAFRATLQLHWQLFRANPTLALVDFQGPPTLALVAFPGPPTLALAAFQGPPTVVLTGILLTCCSAVLLLQISSRLTANYCIVSL